MTPNKKHRPAPFGAGRFVSELLSLPLRGAGQRREMGMYFWRSAAER